MRYIDYKKILSPDELQALGGVMARLKKEAKSVRVSKLGDASGSERMDLTPMLMSGVHMYFSFRKTFESFDI